MNSPTSSSAPCPESRFSIVVRSAVGWLGMAGLPLLLVRRHNRYGAARRCRWHNAHGPIPSDDRSPEPDFLLDRYGEGCLAPRVGDRAPCTTRRVNLSAFKRPRGSDASVTPRTRHM